jgi:cyclomaltodextrinase
MTDHPSSPPAVDSEPDWVRHAILWQVYPLGATGAPGRALPSDSPTEPAPHRLTRLVGWLDYVVGLGASVILLGPVFASETHGYDTVDHLRIDPRLGDEHDFDALVTAAHERGLRIVLDGVFNHVGRGFPPFQDALLGGEHASWFRRVEGADAGDPRFDTFEGHDALVALNHDEPAVADMVVDVMLHWLDRGADGWRLDAAYAVPPRFWASVLPRVRERHPDAFIVGEVIHGDYSAIVDESGMDSVTQYEVWKAIRSAVDDANLFELDHALGRHDDLLPRFAPLTFVGNHDVTRLASAIDDERHLPHAVVVLLTIGGTPTIYYGDEQGFRGIKEERAGGDDEIRPALPAAGPTALSPLGEPLFRLHQELIGLRRRNPWLHRATHRALHLRNTEYIVELSSGAHRIVVALNIGDAPMDIEVHGLTAVLAGTARLERDGIQLRPHGWAVVSADPVV